MDTPTNTPDINQNNNVLPIESILSQPDNNLLKSHFVKVNVVPVPKKDGTTGYVIGNQPRGIASSVTRSGFSLDMRVSKKAVWSPNEKQTKAGFYFESWLWGTQRGFTEEETDREFQLMLGIYGVDETGYIVAYLHRTNHDILLTTNEYSQLA